VLVSDGSGSEAQEAASTHRSAPAAAARAVPEHSLTESAESGGAKRKDTEAGKPRHRRSSRSEDEPDGRTKRQGSGRERDPSAQKRKDGLSIGGTQSQ